MRVALGSDEDAAILGEIEEVIAAAGHSVAERLVGLPWPEVGRRVGEAVACGAADAGVVCCWTGTGVSMAANKVPGVRAALCADAATAAGARRWNDANVLALSLRATSSAVAREILGAFFGTEADPDETETIDLVERGSERP